MAIPEEATASAAQRLCWDFLEMVLAMLAGMLVLAPVWAVLWPRQAPELHVLVMATDMALGMAVWMRVRKHRWTYVLTMVAAMYVPLGLLLVPYGLGALDGDVLDVAVHVAMLPFMFLAMRRLQGGAQPVAS